MWLDTPEYTLRTVPPSSMVFRLVARAREELTLMISLMAKRSHSWSLATATAAPTVPQVPWGCMDMRILEAMPMRAPVS
jgi:hypothetical protein